MTILCSNKKDLNFYPKVSKYCPAVPDGGEYGGVGAHGVGAHPGLADVVKTAAEEG